MKVGFSTSAAAARPERRAAETAKPRIAGIDESSEWRRRGEKGGGLKGKEGVAEMRNLEFRRSNL